MARLSAECTAFRSLRICCCPAATLKLQPGQVGGLKGNRFAHYLFLGGQRVLMRSYYGRLLRDRALVPSYAISTDGDCHKHASCQSGSSPARSQVFRESRKLTLHCRDSIANKAK